MATLSFDTGVKEYDVDGRATLRFNPTDPELFARILDLMDRSDEIEQRYETMKKNLTGEKDEQGFPVGAAEVVAGMRELDRDLKEGLADIFGRENDFDAIFEHKSCLALTDTGLSILNNFFEAVTPLIEGDSNLRIQVSEKVNAARQKAEGNRAQRRQAARNGRR